MLRRHHTEDTDMGLLNTLRGGTTEREAVKGRDILDEARMAKESAREAVNLLHGLTEPTPEEAGDLDAIKVLLTTIAERMVSMDDRLGTLADRLSAIERRLPGPRAASPA